MVNEFGRVWILATFSFVQHCITKNIVHLADSAKNEDGSNKQTYK
jgi:hypothetical protein